MEENKLVAFAAQSALYHLPFQMQTFKINDFKPLFFNVVKDRFVEIFIGKDFHSIFVDRGFHTRPSNFRNCIEKPTFCTHRIMTHVIW